MEKGPLSSSTLLLFLQTDTNAHTPTPYLLEFGNLWQQYSTLKNIFLNFLQNHLSAKNTPINGLFLYLTTRVEGGCILDSRYGSLTTHKCGLKSRSLPVFNMLMVCGVGIYWRFGNSFSSNHGSSTLHKGGLY